MDVDGLLALGMERLTSAMVLRKVFIFRRHASCGREGGVWNVGHVYTPKGVTASRTMGVPGEDEEEASLDAFTSSP